jgi:O-acetylhomoserine/O-acetylserine sulfhydrylase-like pyridoxal-dependent enzyme
MADQPQYRLETLALHAGQTVDSDTRSRAVHI